MRDLPRVALAVKGPGCCWNTPGAVGATEICFANEDQRRPSERGQLALLRQIDRLGPDNALPAIA